MRIKGTEKKNKAARLTERQIQSSEPKRALINHFLLSTYPSGLEMPSMLALS